MIIVSNYTHNDPNDHNNDDDYDDNNNTPLWPETGSWLLTLERVVRDVVCSSHLCWKYEDFAQKLKIGTDIECLPRSSK